MTDEPRIVATYNAASDAALRWPEWRILTTDFHGVTTELLCPSKRAVLVDQEWYEQDPEWAVAHQVAHLDLGHHLDLGRPYTEEDESQGGLAGAASARSRGRPMSAGRSALGGP